MLRDIARDIFTLDLDQDHSHSTAELNEESKLEIQDSEEPERMVIPDDEDDSLILLTVENVNEEPASTIPDGEVQEKKYSTMFNDIFYRPPELDSMCVWDISRQFVKEKMPKSKTQRKTYLRFKPGHPQYTTHCLKKFDSPVIPVLIEYRVPRNDSESVELKYAVVILSLFKPGQISSHPLSRIQIPPGSMH
jgi:hypothetical protein